MKPTTSHRWAWPRSPTLMETRSIVAQNAPSKALICQTWNSCRGSRGQNGQSDSFRWRQGLCRRVIDVFVKDVSLARNEPDFPNAAFDCLQTEVVDGPCRSDDILFDHQAAH